MVGDVGMLGPATPYGQSVGGVRDRRGSKMPLSREDFLRASQGEPLAIPPEMFGPPPTRGEEMPDHPDLRRCVDWLKSYLQPGEWESRRNAAFTRLYASAYGFPAEDERGRFFDESDKFGWYLFLAEAFFDHPWNYEPMYGSRVVPLFAALGRDLELLNSVAGLDERVKRLVGPERRQPNGGVFELLVAAAYRRAGGEVAFRPERPGIAKTHDMDVTIGGRELAVECKRLETSDYGERERMRMRELWEPAAYIANAAERSTFGNVSFLIPVFGVPNRYLHDKVRRWLDSGSPAHVWADEVARGTMGEPDLTPLQHVLEGNEVLSASTRLQELLTGQYVRHARILQAVRTRQGMSPRYIKACDLAILLQWQSLAPASIDAKARDVLKKLAEANSQLPDDKPGIVHIGFEAVEGDEVERARYAKILASTGNFDPKGKPLEYVYIHYFVPESPPDEAWAFDETVHWQKIGGTDPRPLRSAFLVMPGGVQGRDGPHWEAG